MACNAHARRKFYEARGSDPLRSHQALAYYRQLYELERQDLAVPILSRFHHWLERQRPEVLPKSPMGEALGTRCTTGRRWCGGLGVATARRLLSPTGSVPPSLPGRTAAPGRQLVHATRVSLKRRTV
jgi:hypothetical protein